MTEAEACAEALWAQDYASQGLGMVVEHVSSGEATLTIAITNRMLNGHGTSHGGFIFTLADSAFAFACDSQNEVTVAAHCQISFLRPARLGETLNAHAVERYREGRTGLYDVRITAGPHVIAEFRGHSRPTGQAVFTCVI